MAGIEFPRDDSSAHYLLKQKRAEARAAIATTDNDRQMWTEIATHWAHMADRRAREEQARSDSRGENKL